MRPIRKKILPGAGTDTKTTAQNITLVTTGHFEDHQFMAAADSLLTMAPGLGIEFQKNDSDLPGFRLKDNIMYSALPIGKERGFFLEALSHLGTNLPPLSDTILKILDQINAPARLTLYIALHCPFCPDVVRTVFFLALHCRHIRLHIIDGGLFFEAARKNRVLSAPCLILDDDFRWTGRVRAEEIIEMIIHRDPSRLSADTLKTILEQGNAPWITRQMKEKKKIFTAFTELLLHDTWAVRLGAMVVVEELAETDPELATQLCPILMEKFDTADIPVKGDILYALGETGNRRTEEWIRTKQDAFNHPDLIDAAEEALETLASKNP